MNVPSNPGGVNLNTLIMVGGFLFTIGTSAVAIGTVWGQGRAELAALAASVIERLETKQEAINRLNIEVAAIETAATAREARIRSLELGQGRTEERLIAIQAILARIEKQLGEEGR